MESDFVPVVANVTDLFSGEEIISVATAGQVYVQTENKKILAAYPKSFDYGVVDFSINLGTPNRDDYRFNRERVNKVANIYSNWDPIQPFGGPAKLTFNPMTGLYVPHPTIASREIIDNPELNYLDINVSDYGKPGHIGLHEIKFWNEFRDSSDFNHLIN
jgi:hypothetical protein